MVRRVSNSEIKTVFLRIRKFLGETKAVVQRKKAFEVLISTVLSQRTKDETTGKVSEELFSKYKTAKQLASAPIPKIEKLIYGSGFYRTKAKRINQISKILIEKYNGKVPRDFDKLISLPGVGRKTANCVMVFAFGSNAHIPVDTHVHRISNRLGWVKTANPEETELALKKLVQQRYWHDLNELFVKFGQVCCLPRNPKCRICKISEFCPYCPYAPQREPKSLVKIPKISPK